MEKGETNTLAGESLKSLTLSDSDLQKYGKNMKELEELLALEEQYNKASTDLSQTKTKLSEIEVEMQREREREKEQEEKIAQLWEEGLQKEKGGLLNQAMDHYLEILERNPKHARSISHVQELKRDLRLKEQERLSNEQAMTLKRERFETHFQEGQRWILKNEFLKAMEEFQEAIFVDPVSEGAQQIFSDCKQRLQKAEEQKARTVSEFNEKKCRSDELILKALEKNRREDFEGALLLFEEALHVHPEDRAIQEKIQSLEIRLREQRAKLNQEKESKETTRKKCLTLELDAWNLWGNGDFKGALSLWAEIIQMDPSQTEILSRLRQEQENRLFRDEENKKAREEQDRCIQSFYSEGMTALARLDWDMAVEKFSSVLALSPNHVESLNKLNELARKKETRAEHIARTREQEREKLENSRYEEKQRAQTQFIFQAEACMSSMDFEKALIFWEKAFEVDPGDTLVKEGLLKTRVLFQQKNRALQAWQEAKSCMEYLRKKNRAIEKEFQEASRLLQEGFWEQAGQRFVSINGALTEGDDHG